MPSRAFIRGVFAGSCVLCVALHYQYGIPIISRAVVFGVGWVFVSVFWNDNRELGGGGGLQNRHCR